MHILLHRLCSSITYYLMQYCCQTNQTPYDHIGIDLFLATMRFDEKLSKFFMHFKFGKKISKIVKNFYCGLKTALSLFRNASLVFKIINPSCFIYNLHLLRISKLYNMQSDWFFLALRQYLACCILLLNTLHNLRKQKVHNFCKLFSP